MAAKGPEKAAFVDKVVGDAANPPRVKMLTGYVGTSTEKDCIRLYKDAELTEYLEVPNSSILHSETIADDPLGASRLWVERDADLISRGADIAELRGRFLSGAIAGGGVAAAIPQSAIDNCWSALIQCDPPRSRFVACAPPASRLCSWDDGCPSAWIECPPDSRFVVCGDPTPPQSRFLNCSQLDNCRSALIQCDDVISLVGCGPIVSRVCSWDDGCASSLGCTFGTIHERINPGRFRARPRYRGF